MWVSQPSTCRARVGTETSGNTTTGSKHMSTIIKMIKSMTKMMGIRTITRVMINMMTIVVITMTTVMRL